jgi:flagellar biosynthetic protein FlhB
MAEDADPDSKTEEPTHKRLKDAEEKGNIAKSQEIGHWFAFLAAAIAMWMLSGTLSSNFISSTRVFLERPHLIPIDASHLSQVAIDLFFGVGRGLLPVLGLFLLFGLASSVIQNPPRFTVERIKPKFSKLSPIAGLKRMFSVQSAVEFVKNIIKISAIGAILAAILLPELDSLETIVALDVSVLLSLVAQMLVKLIGVLVGIMFVVAVVDYLYQRFTYMKNLRMTRQEVKEEFKEQEGDPIIKARLRQIRMQRVRRRMMASVPEASVVITNPTHYAVALKYDPDKMQAPVVVAKGVDVLALRIREIAKEHEVPIVENPPLARALYKVDLDESIPVEHYRAVAGVISYVMRLKDGMDARYEPEAETEGG